MRDQVIVSTNIHLDIPSGAYYVTSFQDDDCNFVMNAPNELSNYQNPKIYLPTDNEKVETGSSVHWIYVTKKQKVFLLELPLISSSKVCAKSVKEYVLNGLF